MLPSFYHQDRLGREVLEAGRVDGPPRGPWRRDFAYPLALDIDVAQGIAAVSFAILDMYPDIEPGWWCEAVTYSFRDGRWRHAGGESDNSTALDPFSRPTAATNSIYSWCAWPSNGGLGDWSDQDLPRWRHTFFGIAPTTTARLTVTDETGRTRDLMITPWNGAYVAVIAGAYSTLTAYDERGTVLGSFQPMDGVRDEPQQVPEPAPDYERVEGLGNGIAEPLVFRRTAESGSD
jgi:hypothetical protein